MDKGIRLAFIGDEDDLPLAVRQALRYALNKTKDNTNMTFTLALSYSGKAEIVRAAQRAVASGIKAEELTEERFRSFLYAPDTPDPDLIIRTSGELRLSNFLLFQSAYSELYFSPVLWPDFDARELRSALDAFGRRTRRFGKTDEQLEAREKV